MWQSCYERNQGVVEKLVPNACQDAKQQSVLLRNIDWGICVHVSAFVLPQYSIMTPQKQCPRCPYLRSVLLAQERTEPLYNRIVTSTYSYLGMEHTPINEYKFDVYVVN